MKPQPCRWSPPRKPSLALDGILGGAPDIWAGLGSLSQDNCAPHGRGNVLSPSPLIIPGIVVISWQFFSLGDGTRLGWVSAVISSHSAPAAQGMNEICSPALQIYGREIRLVIKALSAARGCWKRFPEVRTAGLQRLQTAFAFWGQ